MKKLLLRKVEIGNQTAEINDSKLTNRAGVPVLPITGSLKDQKSDN
jgi:hypothetical protein